MAAVHFLHATRSIMRIRFLHLLVIAGLVALVSGCSTITTASTQFLRVETYALNGLEVTGAQCNLSNEKGIYSLVTPGAITVRKASGDLKVSCVAPNQPEAIAIITSRVGAGMFGNILFGGGVGAIIDHANGSAYNYPTWIQPVFGRQLSFDRTDILEGQPTPAFEFKDGVRVAYVRPATSAPEAPVPVQTSGSMSEAAGAIVTTVVDTAKQ